MVESWRYRSGSDEVDEYLIWITSKHVKLDKLEQLSAYLRIKEHVYNDIITSFRNEPPQQKFRVVLAWYKMSSYPSTVTEMIEETKKWYLEGFLHKSVWTELRRSIKQDILPTEVEIGRMKRAIAVHRGKQNLQNSISLKCLFVTMVTVLVLLAAITTRYLAPDWHEVIPNVGKAVKDEGALGDNNLLSPKEISEIQKLTKQSLDRQWRNSLSHDWIPRHKARKFPLRDFYVDLKWSRQVRGALQSSTQKMDSIYDILKVPEAGERPFNIIIEGEPGVGKTSSMASLALNWTDNKDSSEYAAISQFDFMFLIQLRYVDKNNPLAEVIKLQHDKLSKVPNEHISALIEGKTKSKVLLLMDGYDEYKLGTSTEIDTAIDKTIGDCFLILTSRPGYIEQTTKDKMDGEITIEGFSAENIRKCSSFYFESDELSERMLQQAHESGINELLRVPIVLLMTCQLFYEKRDLPATKTEIVGSIFRLSMDRTTLKEHNFGLKSMDIKDLHTMLFVLGKFSWRALQNNIQQLVLFKDELEREIPDVMRLGLLNEIGVEEASLREQPTFLPFSHKILQEYAASVYVSKNLAEKKEGIQTIFPDWYTIGHQQEVILFTCGLMDNCSLLADWVYQKFIDDILSNKLLFLVSLRAMFSNQKEIFDALYRESGRSLPHLPLHNEHIHWFQDRDTTRISISSKLYIFQNVESLFPNKTFIIAKNTEISVIFKRVSHEELIHQHKMPSLAEPEIEVIQLCNRNYLTNRKIVFSDFLISPRMLLDIFHQLSDLPKIRRIIIGTVDYEDKKREVNDCKLTMFIGPSLKVDASVICTLHTALRQCKSLEYLDLRGNNLKACTNTGTPLQEYFDLT